MEQSKTKKLLKYIGIPIFTLIVLFLIVVNFSAVESSFKCSGQLSLDGNTQSKTIYMKLTQYRPWVGLWSDSSGSVNLEIPNEWVEYYEHVEEVGDQYQIFETYPQKTLKGNFSLLSKTLAIDLESPFGFFDGLCVAAD